MADMVRSVPKADSMTNICCVVLFRTTNGPRVLLTPEQVSSFDRVIKSIRPYVDRPNGKSIPEPFIFYYWTLSATKNELVEHSISFNHKGRSVSWVIEEDSASEMLHLIGQLQEQQRQMLPHP